MRIRNNSKQEWLNYNCGEGEFVDILPESEFECSERAGRYLLKLLGAPNWLSLIEEPKVVEVSEEPEEVKVEEKPVEVKEEKEEEDEEAKEEPKEVKPPFCDSCDSKGKFHKKGCPKRVVCDYCGLSGRHKLLCRRPQ